MNINRLHLGHFRPLLGIDGVREMDERYGNCIYLSDGKEMIKEKVMKMVTNSKRIKPTDKGEPENCNVYSYYKNFSSSEMCNKVFNWCKGAKKTCVECKSILSEEIWKFIKKIGYVK